MTVEEKLKLLDTVRREMKELDDQKRSLFRMARDKMDLPAKYNNDLWDYTVCGLQFLKYDIRIALEEEEKKRQKDS